MNLNFNGNSSDFRDFANYIHNSICEEIEEVFKSLNNNIDELSDYWKGLSAESFRDTLMEKINRLNQINLDIETIGNNIKTNADKYENRKEQEIEDKKNSAYGRGDMIEYARLCAKDFFDGEFSED